MRALRFVVLALVALTVALPVRAAEGDQLDAVQHSVDGNYLDFLPFAKVELPRFFVVRDASGALGFDFYATTKAALRSGDYVMKKEDGEQGGDSASDDAAAGYGGDSTSDGAYGDGASGSLEAKLASGKHLYETIVPASGSMVIDLSPTRHLLFALLGMLIVALLFISMASKYKKGVGRTSAPKGTLQNMLESIILYVRDEIAVPQLGNKADKYMPYLLTVFFFILTCNLLGLMPYGAAATSNIAITAVLAFFTFALTQMAGTKDYWMHILWPPGIPVLIKFILIPVEILGIFTKPFALAIRLFANITAGHLVILNLIGLIFILAALFGPVVGFGVAVPSILMTVFIYALKVLVSLIQAYVFTILSALFIGQAAEEHDHHHHDESHAHEIARHASAPIVATNGSTQEKQLVGAPVTA
ncbi:MAG: F0F1 ATP synthase subunit A [Bacteroidota bacterium]